MAGAFEKSKLIRSVSDSALGPTEVDTPLVGQNEGVPKQTMLEAQKQVNEVYLPALQELSRAANIIPRNIIVRAADGDAPEDRLPDQQANGLNAFRTSAEALLNNGVFNEEEARKVEDALTKLEDAQFTERANPNSPEYGPMLVSGTGEGLFPPRGGQIAFHAGLQRGQAAGGTSWIQSLPTQTGPPINRELLKGNGKPGSLNQGGANSLNLRPGVRWSGLIEWDSEQGQALLRDFPEKRKDSNGGRWVQRGSNFLLDDGKGQYLVLKTTEDKGEYELFQNDAWGAQAGLENLLSQIVWRQQSTSGQMLNRWVLGEGGGGKLESYTKVLDYSLKAWGLADQDALHGQVELWSQEDGIDIIDLYAAWVVMANHEGETSDYATEEAKEIFRGALLNGDFQMRNPCIVKGKAVSCYKIKLDSDGKPVLDEQGNEIEVHTDAFTEMRKQKTHKSAAKPYTEAEVDQALARVEHLIDDSKKVILYIDGQGVIFNDNGSPDMSQSHMSFRSILPQDLETMDDSPLNTGTPEVSA